MAQQQDTAKMAEISVGERLVLPEPRERGDMSVEEAIGRRRSVRDFAREPLRLAEISQLLWSAQGVTSLDGLRAAPSAGAMYPLELYLLCEQGLFRYQPEQHALVKVRAEDLRRPLADAAYGQTFLAEAAVSLIFAAVYQRTTVRYGERGVRYVHMDVGHAAENVHLQAEALGLGSVAVGAFDDGAVAAALHLPDDHKPVYLVSVGRRAHS